VLLLEPAYDSYEPSVALAGARALRVPLARPGFSVDWDRVRDALTARTRLIIVNTPHNPSGAVFSRQDVDALAELAERHDLFVLGDEVYEHMVFDGALHQSLLRRKVHQFVQFAVTAPMQAAIADFLTENPAHHRELPAFYQRKRDHFLRLLAATRLRAVPSAGTYFQLADYSGVSDERDTEFVRRLTTETGVAAIPVSVFSTASSGERLVRFCFAKHDATLDEAGERLRRL
jgi:methionine aminotransferase